MPPAYVSWLSCALGEGVCLTQLGPPPQSIAKDIKVENDTLCPHVPVAYTVWLWRLHVPSILHLGNFSSKLHVCTSPWEIILSCPRSGSLSSVLFLAPSVCPLSKVVIYRRNKNVPADNCWEETERDSQKEAKLSSSIVKSQQIVPQTVTSKSNILLKEVEGNDTRLKS